MLRAAATGCERLRESVSGRGAGRCEGLGLFRSGGATVKVVGLGIDIVEIARIRQVANRHKRKLARVFQEPEIDYCWQAQNIRERMSRLAGRFAAKEAVIKALGGTAGEFTWLDVMILPAPSGAPEVQLTDRGREAAQRRGVDRILLSISHARRYAVAQALAVALSEDEV